jgi:hypothetical protein
MTDAEPAGAAADGGRPVAAGPLVFISHDSRDAPIAEAFSKLLSSVINSGNHSTPYSNP